MRLSIHLAGFERKIYWCIIVTAILAVAWPWVCAASPLVLIENGQAKATIVRPAGSDTLIQRTATDIQDTLEQMTGVELPILDDNQPITGNRVLLGETVWTDAVVSPAERATLGTEGFILRRDGNDIALAGGSTSYGVAYAASEMLERLGVRWFIPHSLGDVIPETNTVQFDTLDVREEPTFSMRFVGVETDWSLHVKSNRIWQEPTLPPSPAQYYPHWTHTTPAWLPHDELYETHPEYFALIGGVRSTDPLCHPCVSDANVAIEIAGRMKAYLDTNPGPVLLVVGPPDNQLICQCGPCTALDESGVPVDQRYSRRYLLFYNAIAEELAKYYPSQKILCWAYQTYTSPPVDASIQAHANVSILVTHVDYYCLVHTVNDPTCSKNQTFMNILNGWKNQVQVSDLYTHEYYNKTSWLDLPWPLINTIKSDIPFYNSFGLEGMSTQHSSLNPWADIPNHYLAAKLMWDPCDDANDILDDFYEKFYGDGSVPMKNYHELLTQQMMNATQHFAGTAKWWAKYVFTDTGVFDQLEGYIQQAYGLESDTDVVARLDKLSLLMQYSRRLMKFLWLRDRALAATGVEKCHLLRLAVDAGNGLKEDINNGVYGDVVNGIHFTDNYQMVREINSLQELLDGCDSYVTYARFSFDEYVPGYDDRVYVESDSSPNAYTFWFKSSNPNDITLDDEDALLGFETYLVMSGTDDLSWGKTLSPFVDLRRQTMTAEGWVRLNTIPSPADYILARHFPNGRPWSIQIEPGGKLVFSHYQIDGWKTVKSNSALSLVDNWYHVSIKRTYEPTADPCQFDYGVEFYINGSLDASHFWTGVDYGDVGWAWDHENNRVFIGGYPSSPYPEFDGCVDEFRITGQPLPGTCENGDYLPTDLNQDCYVDAWDLWALVQKWLACNWAFVAECSEYTAEAYWLAPLERTEPNTEILLHFDDYVPGYANRTYGEDTTSATAYQFWLNAPPYIDLDSNTVSYPGFNGCLRIDGSDNGQHGRTLSPVTDTRRGGTMFEAWVRLQSYPASDYYILCHQQLYGHWLAIEIQTDGTVKYRHHHLDGWSEVSTAGSLPLGQWRHLAMTRQYEPTADPCLFDYRVDFYIDGALDSSHSWTGADYADGWDPTSANNRLYVGGYLNSPYPEFDGYIDEVRLSSVIRTLGGACETGNYLDADINADCVVHMRDLSEIASDWLKCNSGTDPHCEVF